jgi:hypothetical protein
VIGAIIGTGVIAGAAGVLGLIGAGAYAISRSNHHARVRAWRDAALACGVRNVEPTHIVGFPQQVSGRKNGLEVRIGTYTRGKQTGTWIAVSPLAAVTPLGLCRETLGVSIMKGLLGSRKEIELGDDFFDRQFLIEGPAPLALAVLDAATRQQVWRTMGGTIALPGARGGSLTCEARLSAGTLRLEMLETWGVRLAEHLPPLLEAALALAANLVGPRDVPSQLAHNALRDPLWSVRLTNLKTMAREYPRHPETAPMLGAAMADASEEVRLSAAMALGGEGDATLLDLAFGAAPDEIAARALVALADRLPVDRVVRALGEAIDSGRLETVWACLEIIGRHAPGTELTSAEPYLIRATGHAQERLRVAAARALGRVGTTRSVLPLQEAGEHFGGEMRSASRQAVAEIQARAAGAAPGQISLAAEQGGALTLARDDGGEVSLGGD